ncbi:hypothetical protein [Paenibacillus macerans]|uniref:hypothetical protein n=1 Tax=Paenibacillus macerans TaxID=44252 RepID=UPI00203D8928|nr:hypothetical protein [Paenibacillus macerans]MCM3701920.1 hypothetical protein [Paenibacillus macerans]
MSSKVCQIFRLSVQAIQNGTLIHRESRTDKEYHFQNWFKQRLEGEVLFEDGGRNSYPDFRIVDETEGYELKGLAYPGREVTYDCNSQVPTGFHNGRYIFYVFGRYPSKPDGDKYPVLDYVICHGDFLNADHTYVHKNKSVKGFGTYGDIMIRDRKMYVAPTPYSLASGLAHNQTLILPENFRVDEDFEVVGRLTRREANNVIIGYTFNLQTNELTSESIPNPNAGSEHKFIAYRLKGTKGDEVVLNTAPNLESLDEVDDESGLNE